MQGLNSIYAFSLKALLKERSANCIFLTHDANDILDIKFFPKTRIIYTSHGNLIKGGKQNEIGGKKDFSYILAASESCKEVFQKAFKYPSERIIVTGYPRNDFLCNRMDNRIQELKYKFNIPNNSNVILYAPTYREGYKCKNPLTNDEILILERFLDETNSVLIYKSHFNMMESPFIPINSKRLIVLDPLLDPQEILLISDILISDYSSIIFDFLLLDRPIILFLYDLELYLEYVGLYYDLEELNFAPIAKDGKELLYYLKTVSIWNLEYKQNRNTINTYVNKSGNACKRIANFLQLKINS